MAPKAPKFVSLNQSQSQTDLFPFFSREKQNGADSIMGKKGKKNSMNDSNNVTSGQLERSRRLQSEGLEGK